MIKSKKQKFGGLITEILLIILAVYMFLPIYLTVVMSIKPTEELFVFPPKLYTLRPTLSNFTSMLESARQNRVPFSRYLFNTVAVTFSVTLCQCVFVSMGAFVLAKCEFYGKRIVNALIITALLYQSNVIYIMQYMVMSKVGIINTPLALILPSIASPIGFFLMKQSIAQIPDSMIESAKIDGAGLFRICWQIVMPNQKPALMTLIIFAFQASWNIQGGSLIFDEQLKTLPSVILQISSSGLARAGETMASAVFLLIPPVVVFMLAQRQIMDTMVHSGIK
ncbi:MAG: carbohydrate ABC transporter permease [Ruminococcus sp.]|nr:carbohydrate ABC transporter permease [Ruminococcus sp.]